MLPIKPLFPHAGRNDPVAALLHLVFFNRVEW